MSTAAYILPYSVTRSVPPHGFTQRSLCRKRLTENSSSLAITVGFLLPALQRINQRLDKHVADASDVDMAELLSIFSECGAEAAIQFADRLARVGVQTAFACALLKSRNGVANSMVYLWDLYPRLHQRYVGEVLRLLRLPRFLSSLLGGTPTPIDVSFLESRTNSFGAFEDSLKRNTVFLVGDVVVDTVRITLTKTSSEAQKVSCIAQTVVMRVATCLASACGAAAGRWVNAERGEYWGEVIGMALTPMFVLQLTNKLKAVKVRRPSGNSKGGSSRRHHSRDSRTNSATDGDAHTSHRVH